MDNSNSHTEKQLLIQVAQGNEDAFKQLVSRDSEKVFLHALTFVKAWQKAEELVQDIFLKIWQKRDKLSEIDNWDNYLFIVSKNYLISAIRQKVRDNELAQMDTELQAGQNPESQFENKELGNLLENAINRLPEQKQIVFRMIHQEGLSQEEVGQKLGIAARTVRWNLVSAINGLKDFLHRQSSGDIFPILLLFFELI